MQNVRDTVIESERLFAPRTDLGNEAPAASLLLNPRDGVGRRELYNWVGRNGLT